MGRILAFLPPGGVPGGYFEDITARAAASGSSIIALYVVDAVWLRFSSADWLSTGPSRSMFDHYMQETLAAEGNAMADALRQHADMAGVPFTYEAASGDPADVIVSAAAAAGADEVVVPYGYSAAGRMPGLDCGLVVCGRT